MSAQTATDRPPLRPMSGEIGPAGRLDLPRLRSAHRAPAKGRILETADALFYQDGIRSVGVDRIIAASSVTKATFYKHYRAKDNLIIEYITHRHVTEREALDGIITAAGDPRTALTNFVSTVIARIDTAGYRGSAFINAAAEFPQPEHPVRQIVTAHREWFVDTLAGLLREMGHPVPGDAADELVLALDGATAGGYAGDPVASAAALGRVTERIVRAATRRA